MQPLASRIATVAVLAIAAVPACKCKSEAPATDPAPGGRGITGAPAGRPLADQPHYRIDAGPRTPCAPNSRCEVRVVVTALGDYHINDKYPTKLIADATPPGVSIDGTGTFALDSAKVGTLTLAYKAPRGTHKVTATLKLCVCTDENCVTRDEKIELELVAT